MGAQAENLSLGILMTQALLVPLETMNEEISDSFSQAIWFIGLKLLLAAKPCVSPVPLWDIPETEARTVFFAKVLGIGLYLSHNSELGIDWLMWACLVDVQFREKDGKVCRAHLGAHAQRISPLTALCGHDHFLEGLCPSGFMISEPLIWTLVMSFKLSWSRGFISLRKYIYFPPLPTVNKLCWQTNARLGREICEAVGFDSGDLSKQMSGLGWEGRIQVGQEAPEINPRW